MAEYFQFDIHPFSDIRHFRKGYFSGKNDAGRAHIFPSLDGAPVCRARLRAHMDRQIRRCFTGDIKYAEIGNQDGIRMNIL